MGEGGDAGATADLNPLQPQPSKSSRRCGARRDGLKQLSPLDAAPPPPPPPPAAEGGGRKGKKKGAAATAGKAVGHAKGHSLGRSSAVAAGEGGVVEDAIGNSSGLGLGSLNSGSSSMPSSVSGEYACFERHTTGIGSKLLAKWGFGGEGSGLGPEGRKGRAEPLLAAKRPKGLGLGAN
jgi:hypothetical protein